jgi:hypothetical protein
MHQEDCPLAPAVWLRHAAAAAGALAQQPPDDLADRDAAMALADALALLVELGQVDMTLTELAVMAADAEQLAERCECAAGGEGAGGH